MKTPWQYAETGNEHSHQVALFMWANMACKFGLRASNDPQSYVVRGHALRVLAQANADLLHDLKWLHAIKNAGHGDAVRGNHARAEGVKAGVPDIFLPVLQPEHFGSVLAHGLYIELKRPYFKGRKGVVSDVQSEWCAYLRSAGYAVELCFGWEAARDAILKYLGR